MTSDRAIYANRRNAQSSTGPKTGPGKKRSKQNAHKHGLSVTSKNSAVDAEIEDLAKLIAGRHHFDTEVIAAARLLARAQHDIRRVKNLKTTLLEAKNAVPSAKIRPEDAFSVEILTNILVLLERVDRYERRAMSRRKFAARQVIELVRRASQV